jgi:Glycosyl transferase family 2
MSSLAISVLMSVCNGQEFLSEAMESVLQQTYRDFEFLIIDDGSTDATPEILKRYADKDERIRIHRHDNRGRAESLNVGMELAKGKYVARIDADDVALPDRLGEQLEFLESHPEVGLLGGAFELMSRRGQILREVRFPTSDEEIRGRMLVDNPICHPTVMMKKEVAKASGGYRKALVDADDYDLWLRMLEQTQAANLDECVLRYRVHAGQVSVRYLTHQKECVLAARAAAAIRRAGGADPLVGIERVTPQLLNALGVSGKEIREQVLSGYRYWIEVLEKSDPEAALEAIGGLLELSGSMARRERANTWLRAARIHAELGKPMRALFSASRGFLVRPIVAGRPFKRAFLRLATALKN